MANNIADKLINAHLERCHEYSEIEKFRKKIENARENLDLADYHHRILWSLLSNDSKDILKENKNMILSNINNLLNVINRVREFAADEL